MIGATLLTAAVLPLLGVPFLGDRGALYRAMGVLTAGACVDVGVWVWARFGVLLACLCCCQWLVFGWCCADLCKWSQCACL